ncbi:hypothetical protein BT67DRAFT_64965 [Trichocladium antarcticum]|uniref:Uncharacterized protein n=1 Tax=Trichocladium antarcticum TaxID=1450529 RepID=A0AAN6UH48_9PEZI|nr:hypothetical protein BT67DRAFT_64965 [Trichocladium antarcticum]
MKQSMALSELFLWGVRGRAQFPMTPKLSGRNTRNYEWAGGFRVFPPLVSPTFCDWVLQRETGQIPRCSSGQCLLSGMVGRGRCTVICREAWAGRLWANPLASAVMYRLPSRFGRSRRTRSRGVASRTGGGCLSRRSSYTRSATEPCEGTSCKSRQDMA